MTVCCDYAWVVYIYQGLWQSRQVTVWICGGQVSSMLCLVAYIWLWIVVMSKGYGFDAFIVR